MKLGISTQGLRRLAQNFENPSELYHVTYNGNLQSIAEGGLQVAFGEGIGNAALDDHKEKGIFLTSKEGLSFWHGKSTDWSEHRSDNPYEDELTPVVLLVEIPDPSKLIPDEIGSDDALADAFIYPEAIPPANIYVWDGGEDPGWYEIETVLEDPLDTSTAYDIEEEMDEETGEETDLYYFKEKSPFFPTFEN